MWTQAQIHEIVQKQRDFFLSGQTLDIPWRKEQLNKLKTAILRFEPELEAAMAEDLGRSRTEAYFCDIGSTILEINEALRHLSKWARPETHFSGLVNFPSLITKVYKLPYGNTLIISPFNFPVLLSLGVLTASMAGGNTAVIKTSSKAVQTTRVLQKLIEETFPPEYVTVVGGGHAEADLCLSERFDKIFYTGSPKVGRHVLEMAAQNLTPVALELGGENGNWCVIRKDADLRDAARKIAFFKLCNSGQVCININQVAVAEKVAREFLRLLQEEFRRQIGKDALRHPEYPHLISDDAYEKCAWEAEQYRERILCGGYGNPETRQYAPTIIYPVSPEEDIVMHELFSPLLPVVPFKEEKINDLLQLIARREHPLAMYLFTSDKAWAKKVFSSSQYGGGCVNEVCQHLMVKGVPFNGTGHSGMGAYHGEWGFREFTHPSTVMFGKTRGNLPLREHPYRDKSGEWKLQLIRWFER